MRNGSLTLLYYVDAPNIIIYTLNITLSVLLWRLERSNWHTVLRKTWWLTCSLKGSLSDNLINLEDWLGLVNLIGESEECGENVHSHQTRLLLNLEHSYSLLCNHHCAFVHHKHYTCIFVSLERSRRITSKHISQCFCDCIHSENNILETLQG